MEKMKKIFDFKQFIVFYEELINKHLYEMLCVFEKESAL